MGGRTSKYDNSRRLAKAEAGVADRFAGKLDKSHPGGCWSWQARRDRDGYGKFWWDGKHYGAHRAALMLQGVVIPPGMVVDHICRNPPCCNPDHLRVVTPAVNSTENSSSVSAVNKRKVVCIRGHPLSGSNLELRRNGGRACRECQRNNKREQKRRKALRRRQAA